MEKYNKVVELLKRDFSACGNRIIGSEESFKSAVLVPFVNFKGRKRRFCLKKEQPE